MANYTLQVTTYTPLHIGNGNELSHKFDYVVGKKDGKDVTGRLNVDEILRKKNDKRFPDKLPGDLISGEKNNPAFYRYIISGVPISNDTDSRSRIRECIKDSKDIPYIPGSTLKGAIRTIFGSKFLLENKRKYSLEKEVPFTEKDKYGNIRKINSKNLDDKINSIIFNEKIKDDPFRAIMISDALLQKQYQVPHETMRILNTKSYSFNDSKVPIVLECMQNNLNFYGTLKIDDYAIKENHFNSLNEFANNLMGNIRNYTYNRLIKLLDWYEKLENAEKVTNRIAKLKEINSNLSDNRALLQIGFGTGWDGMTYSAWLRPDDDDDFFENLYENYLRKPTKGKTPSREPGTDFPTSRKIIQQSEKPVVPLGWVLLTLEPK